MKPIRKVLVAVKNPDRASQPGVEKAIRIARLLGASVELFNAISTPVFMEIEPLKGRSLAELKRESLQLRYERLDRFARRARKLGVQASCHVEWDYPPHEAIVRRADHLRADLIIAECHEGRRTRPWIMHLTDWELLRLSSRPVLLLRNSRPWREPVILAAVDPAHAHDKPARFDYEVVAQAARFARAAEGSFELVHANYPTGFGLVLVDPAIDSTTLTTAYEAQKASSRASFEKFARATRIPKARCHLLDTDPIFAIPQVAREIGADLVVMGAVSRSGLKRVFIGNTAERLLDDLPCDVLVVKPPRTASRVTHRSRGMRVIPPQPLVPLPI
jgi:universal stress protein E